MGRLQDADWAFSVALSCTLRTGLEWPHRVLCHVACLAVVGEVMLKKPRIQGAIVLSRLRFVGLSLPLLGSSFGLAPV